VRALLVGPTCVRFGAKAASSSLAGVRFLARQTKCAKPTSVHDVGVVEWGGGSWGLSSVKSLK